VDSPMLRVNYDTGNAWLGGADPYEGLQAVVDRVVHVHAKDIDPGTGEALRGKLTGTPVGCACGDGVINWRKVTEILRSANYNGVLSVECGTPEQAERSLHHLKTILEAYDEHDALRVVD
jgi:sugar phosphate isomerase/epimerase